MGYRMTESDKATMRSLRKSGHTNKEISEITGFTMTTVRTVVGLDPPKGVEKPCESCGKPTRSKYGICQSTRKCQLALSTKKHELDTANRHLTGRSCANCGRYLRKDSENPYCRRKDSPECRQKYETYRNEHGGREQALQRTKNNPIRTLLGGIKFRAKERNIPYDLTLDNIPPVPEFCPVFGFRLCFNIGNGGKGQPRFNSPSLDRIIPELGYIAGNVQWLSMKANAMKQDATPCELLAFAKWASEQAQLAECA